uniref:Uncharacterized protein n=1 Tax=Cacopsylla melanoneura TaxID=428564 RepID=A0A8D8VGE0_9HEMI
MGKFTLETFTQSSSQQDDVTDSFKLLKVETALNGMQPSASKPATPMKMKTIASLHKTKEQILSNLKQYIEHDMMALVNQTFDAIERDIEEKDNQYRVRDLPR